MKLLKTVPVLIIIISSFFLFPSIVDTFLYLNRKTVAALSPSETPETKQWASDVKQSKRPLGGEYGLPSHVQLIILSLRAYRAPSFDISDETKKDEETTQHLIEASYPIRYSQDTHFFIRRVGESVLPGCEPILSQEGYALVYCP